MRRFRLTDSSGQPRPPTIPALSLPSLGATSKEGMYVVRLKVPAGFKIAPHNHTNDENVTVLIGQLQHRNWRQSRGKQRDDDQNGRLLVRGQRHEPLCVVYRRDHPATSRDGSTRRHLREPRRRSPKEVGREEQAPQVIHPGVPNSTYAAFFLLARLAFRLAGPFCPRPNAFAISDLAAE
jgi:hypothetical protein